MLTPANAKLAGADGGALGRVREGREMPPEPPAYCLFVQSLERTVLAVSSAADTDVLLSPPLLLQQTPSPDPTKNDIFVCSLLTRANAILTRANAI